jgi:hypothetical protein
VLFLIKLKLHHTPTEETERQLVSATKLGASAACFCAVNGIQREVKKCPQVVFRNEYFLHVTLSANFLRKLSVLILPFQEASLHAVNIDLPARVRQNFHII